MTSGGMPNPAAMKEADSTTKKALETTTAALINAKPMFLRILLFSVSMAPSSLIFFTLDS